MVKSYRPAIVVHGGAGSISEDDLPDRLVGCRQAALEGWKALEKGGSALDAVEIAVIALEDNPLFNAGTGSALNFVGEVEMDAAIMDGRTLTAGAVAAVKKIKNPISLARRVLEDGRHVLLGGEGALCFARECGMREDASQSLIVEREHGRWKRKYGTVGCVALDQSGKIAAGTSTGGVFGKLPGRIGDSPLLGCGTYADETGGASCTGNGEAIIRVVLAKTALDFVRAGSGSMDAAKRAVLVLKKKTGAQGGLILLDRHGRIGYARNTTRMPLCLISDSGQIVTDS